MVCVLGIVILGLVDTLYLSTRTLRAKVCRIISVPAVLRGLGHYLTYFGVQVPGFLSRGSVSAEQVARPTLS